MIDGEGELAIGGGEGLEELPRREEQVSVCLMDVVRSQQLVQEALLAAQQTLYRVELGLHTFDQKARLNAHRFQPVRDSRVIETELQNFHREVESLSQKSAAHFKQLRANL